MGRPWNQPSPDREWVKRPSKPFDGAKRYSEIYNTWRWRQKRANFLKRHPLCAICKRNGFDVPAEVVDHIIPIAEGGAAWDENNYQALCKKCHRKKSNREINKRR